MFDHPNSSPLMNSNNSHHQQVPSQGHPPFGQPAFNQAGQGPGPLGLFQREPPRPNLPPQGHQGMGGLGQHGGPPNNRQFMGGPGLRQSFPPQQNPFNAQQLPFGMQVRMRVSDLYNLYTTSIQ